MKKNKSFLFAIVGWILVFILGLQVPQCPPILNALVGVMVALIIVLLVVDTGSHIATYETKFFLFVITDVLCLLIVLEFCWYRHWLL